MKISCNNGIINNRVGDEKGIVMLAQAGFDAIDFHPEDAPNGRYGRWLGEDYRTQARSLLELAKSHGVYYCQAHAPLTPQTLGQGGPDLLGNTRFDYYERFFHVCQLLQIPYMVVHPLSDSSLALRPEEKFAKNVEFFRRLKELAQPYGVRVALENLYLNLSTPHSICRMLDALNDDYFVACVDVGHSNMINPDTGHLIRRLGSRVQALHIHDNHVEYDEHLIPGMGMVDWNSILEALADIHYSGCFNLEISDHACGSLTEGYGFGMDFLPEVLKFTQRSCRYLADKLEAMLKCR